MKTKSLFAALCVSFGLMGVSAAAHADDTITLGRTIVFENNDYGAEIPLLVCRRVNAIKVKADRDMYLSKIKVTFKNGDKKTFNFFRRVKEDNTTDWRRLPYKRCVKHIEVFAESKNSSAGVRVLGRQ